VISNSNEFDEHRAGEWDAATENDIYQCYRLLLNREPDHDGWTTFLSNIQGGMRVQSLVAVFLNSVEFRNRTATQTAAELSPRLVEADGFRIFVYENDSPGTRAITEGRSYEPHIVKRLRRLLQAGHVFVDVGASIGYLSMAAAGELKDSGKVICFEPDLHSCKLIYLSAKANHFHNIEIFPFAVADRERNVIFDSMQGNGVISDFDVNLESTPMRFVTRAMTLDKVLQDEAVIDVIKMDIEGAEYLALQGAQNLLRKHRPAIISEFSPAALRNVSGVPAEAYLQKLISERYGISVLEFDGRVIECGVEIQKVMNVFDQHGTSHIDILATPE